MGHLPVLSRMLPTQPSYESERVIPTSVIQRRAILLQASRPKENLRLDLSQWGWYYGKDQWLKLTMGSTSFTPLSSAGLWLAVTITPIHCPLSFFDRRLASKPTAKTTVFRRSLRSQIGQNKSASTKGRSRGSRDAEAGWIKAIFEETYAFMRNCNRENGS